MTLLFDSIFLIVSVLLGGSLVVFIHSKNQGKIINFLLSLSGGFLLAIAFIHFIPEIYHSHNKSIGNFVLVGFLIQLFLEYFSGGIEHGHVHGKHIKGAIPWSLFIALSCHSLLESIPLGMQDGAVDVHLHSHGLGDGMESLLIGIILHKIPVSIALMTLLLASQFKKSKAWLILFAFALMSPLGIIIGHFGSIHSYINIEIILAIVVGMFLHISTTIIFESSENHRFDFLKLLSLLVGVGVALLIIS